MAKMTHFHPAEPVSVLVAEPLDRLLDYKAPEGGVRLGAYVAVPLGPRRVLGVVWGQGQGGFDPARMKAIGQVLDVPPMRAEMMEFLTRAADYTVTPLSMMLRLATRAPGLLDPPAMQRVLALTDTRPERMTEARERVIAVLQEHGGLRFRPVELAQLAGVGQGVIKGLIDCGTLVIQAAPRDAPFARLDPDLPGKDLSADQARAATALRASAQAGGYGTTLLKGVTGSGKTEVYLEAVAETLKQGRQALVMLPEIALTSDFIERVEVRFGTRPAQWHYGITMTERRRTWHAVARGQAQLVVGARSALFLPFQNLGLVVVDEEHDSSYKQEEGVIYHGRDLAVLRASIGGAQVVLATATPSLESWANAKADKYARLDLPARFGTAELPQMAAIDMRGETMQANTWISPTLRREMRKSLQKGEQSLLFLNRRGYAPLTICRACGEQVGCDHCDARMVEHRFQQRLICHQCGAWKPIPTTCPSCEVDGKMAILGPGVERLAEEVAEVFPDARVAILSSDLSDSARGLKALIDDIVKGEADIVIGTQLVAKGHNFPHLTLVGVIDADLGLQGGDLRAAEKSFQLIRQVAGRAGRAEKPGRVFLQTHQPDHPVIRAILLGDEDGFLRTEAESRAAAGAPPYGRMVGIIVQGPKEDVVFRVAGDLARHHHALTDTGASLFGPAAAPIARIRGNYRVRLLIKAPKGLAIQPALRHWLAPLKPPANTRVIIDIDPQSFY